uniref:Uncharacterized protein n=1 Tax=Candidatus Kentrum sp. MB TaxID=2138164 RepID=A0A450Y1D8_9GAMM|nr:MAG: hypothetical protein BECKMB1821G_GA0114241_11199 [Candidatus Kentron sp. MB]VFK35358.1 MAG: hypothetical protein BECKMB1821I_GA0114274_111312 [Candidatus Kentron sp. MB]VFK77244.1 MAG: hypothetical protein BECKMB1821H_GA0114242_111312 [Candidatus Kentron sp. MB]
MNNKITTDQIRELKRLYQEGVRRTGPNYKKTRLDLVTEKLLVDKVGISNEELMEWEKEALLVEPKLWKKT